MMQVNNLNSTQYYSLHPEKKKEHRKLDYSRHSKRYIEKAIEWNKNNPTKHNDFNNRYIEKLVKEVGDTYYRYRRYNKYAHHHNLPTIHLRKEHWKNCKVPFRVLRDSKGRFL